LIFSFIETPKTHQRGAVGIDSVCIYREYIGITQVRVPYCGVVDQSSKNQAGGSMPPDDGPMVPKVTPIEDCSSRILTSTFQE